MDLIILFLKETKWNKPLYLFRDTIFNRLTKRKLEWINFI